MINPIEAPMDTVKLITITELLLRSNPQYETTITFVMDDINITFEKAI
jgi:hypothetical protein